MSSSTAQPNRPHVDVVTLANTLVLNSQGQQLKVGHLWQKSMVVLVFLRHFACIACRAHAVEVWNERERYEKTGAKIIFIGNGAPEYIEAFKEELGLEKALILTDPTLMSFRASGFKCGYFKAFNLHTAFNMASLKLQGHSGSLTEAQGSRWQMGGVLALNTDGKVLYHYVSESVGDLPAEEDVAELVNNVAVAAASSSSSAVG